MRYHKGRHHRRHRAGGNGGTSSFRFDKMLKAVGPFVMAAGGSGDINAIALHSETANVVVNGSGDAGLTVAEMARVSVNGSGDVDILGNGQCVITQNGSGDVDCATPTLANSANGAPQLSDSQLEAAIEARIEDSIEDTLQTITN